MKSCRKSVANCTESAGPDMLELSSGESEDTTDGSSPPGLDKDNDTMRFIIPNGNEKDGIMFRIMKADLENDAGDEDAMVEDMDDMDGEIENEGEKLTIRRMYLHICMAAYLFYCKQLVLVRYR